MHHAKDQIGLEAFEGRMQKYPDLDLNSHESLDLQTGQETSGTGVIDTYVWDDPGLKSQRVIAFQAISIQGERWIINSTIPVQELSGPLEA